MSFTPPYGPCEPWALDDTCASAQLPDDTDEALIAQMQEVSTSVLWAESGRRYGECPVTLRPCLRRCIGGSGFPSAYKDVDGAWRNFAACGCIEDCSCSSLCEIVLPGPVSTVTEVLIDGTGLDAGAYRVDIVGGQRRLLRLDGECWPTCQDMTASCDEEGSFCVTYEQGMPLDAAAILAHSTLTYELVRACTPGCECRLPRNIISKTRQGVSVSFDLTKSWMRALPEVAMWLDAVNPQGLTSEPTVFTPDLPQTRISG